MSKTRKEVINELHEVIEIPLTHRNLYFELGVPPPKAYYCTVLLEQERPI